MLPGFVRHKSITQYIERGISQIAQLRSLAAVALEVSPMEMYTITKSSFPSVSC